jgi:hypothetical protein
MGIAKMSKAIETQFARLNDCSNPSGPVLLTVPFGQPTQTLLHRVYDTKRLESLLAKFTIETMVCYGLTNGFWSQTSPEQLETVDSTRQVQGIALVRTSKPR